jgi:hypothetical protein
LAAVCGCGSGSSGKWANSELVSDSAFLVLSAAIYVVIAARGPGVPVDLGVVEQR